MARIPFFSRRCPADETRRKGAAFFVMTIAVYGVWCSFVGYAAAPDPGTLSQESLLMADLERRLAPLRDSLSAGQAVGYVTAGPGGDTADVTRRYVMARYILAPAVVFDDPLRTPLVVDLSDDTALDAYVRGHGLTIVYRPADAPPGVAIAARGAP